MNTRASNISRGGLKLAWGLVASLGLMVNSACDEAPTVASDGNAAAQDQPAVLSAKPTCPGHPSCGDGGGSGGAEPSFYADLQPGGVAGELVDPDGGGRLGSGWTTAFDLQWDADAAGWVRAGSPGTSTECESNYPDHKFGLLEGNMKGGDVTTVWLRGDDGNGTGWSSNKVAVTPQTPDPAGWTLRIRKYIDVGTGNGQKKDVVCTVYIHDILFTPVN